jgi:hypothetical protein
MRRKNLAFLDTQAVFSSAFVVFALQKNKIKPQLAQNYYFIFLKPFMVLNKCKSKDCNLVFLSDLALVASNQFFFFINL